MKLGMALAKTLTAGSVVALRGTLGSGKTVFTRGVVRALGTDEPVTSPTFTIVNEYLTKPPLLHIDLYRVSGPEEFALLGISERFPGSITMIEWPEHAEDELDDVSYTVSIEINGENERTITIEPDPELNR